MESLIKWMIDQLERGSTYEVIEAKLEMLLCVVRTVPSYTVEDIIENMIKEDNNAE